MKIYNASIKVFGKQYTAKGPTPLDAISYLNPEKARGVCVLTISKGYKSKEIILNRLQVARLFSPAPAIRAATLKNVAERFDL